MEDTGDAECWQRVAVTRTIEQILLIVLCSCTGVTKMSDKRRESNDDSDAYMLHRFVRFAFMRCLPIEGQSGGLNALPLYRLC
jgi:hypothetical protein